MPSPRQDDLMTGSQIVSQLRALDKGGYARTYQTGGRTYRTSLHMAVGSLFDSLGLHYEQDMALSQGSKVRADFIVNGGIAIFVSRQLSAAEKRTAIDSGKKCLLIEMSEKRGDPDDSGLRVSELAVRKKGPERETLRLQTIFLDDPSFNFDYAHILPQTEKCSVMHGHTSSALVELVGAPMEGMVVDFNDAKPIIKKAISDLDHKLFINEKYVTGRTPTHVDLKFSTVHGEFSMHVPVETTILLEGEATVENLAQELLRRISPSMPENVEAVGVYVYEGLNKGTHLLARLHSRGAETRRKQ